MPTADAVIHRAKCREWSREADLNRKRARAAVARADAHGGEFIAAAIEKVRRCSREARSEARLTTTLNLLDGAPAAVFWPVFKTEWMMCDATWAEQSRLLPLLKMHAGQRPRDRNEFWQALPETVPVFRGCSRARVLGLSWTTRPEVAKGYAVGHRQKTVLDPVVASATGAKGDVLWATDDRDEAEILLDPASLADLTIDP